MLHELLVLFLRLSPKLSDLIVKLVHILLILVLEFGLLLLQSLFNLLIDLSLRQRGPIYGLLVLQLLNLFRKLFVSQLETGHFSPQALDLLGIVAQFLGGLNLLYDLCIDPINILL